MNSTPGISDTEWTVMKVIWNNAPCPASKIIDELSGTNTWKPKTIKTLINRLLKKKAIGFTEESRAYIYFPLVTEEECVKAESSHFLDRVFSGKLNIALANFIENKKLTNQEIDELRKMLDEKRSKD